MIYPDYDNVRELSYLKIFIKWKIIIEILRRALRVFKTRSRLKRSLIKFPADRKFREELKESGSIGDLFDVGIQMSDKIKNVLKDDEGRAVTSLMKISFESAKESIPNPEKILIKDLEKKDTKDKILGTFLESHGSDYYLISQPLIEKFSTNLWNIIEPTKIENKQSFFDKFNSSLMSKARSDEDVLKLFEFPSKRPNENPIVIDKNHVQNLANDLVSNNYESIIKESALLLPLDHGKITKGVTPSTEGRHRMLRTATQLEQAFDRSKTSVNDPLTRLKIEDMHSDISRIKTMLSEDADDMPSKASLQESINKFLEKLASSQYTHDYLKRLGTDEARLINSMDIKENEDGSIDIKWKGS